MKLRWQYLGLLSVLLYGQNVGIGTALPASRLSVHGNLSVGSGYSNLSAPSEGMIVEGPTGLGTATPAHQLHVVGDVRFEGNFVNQEITGANASAVQSIAWNATGVPIDGTTVSITIEDGSGPPPIAAF